MIKLRNGAAVFRADLEVAIDQTPAGDFIDSGYVLARTQHGEFVTWYVTKHSLDTEWEAYHGHYFQNSHINALADYQKRRGFDRTNEIVMHTLRARDSATGRGAR